MKRSSPFFNMRWRVDCKPPLQAYFETIAMFNCDRAALAYADECRTGKRPMDGKPWTYEVRERRAKGWVIVTKAAF